MNGYEFEGWDGMCAPTETPRNIVNRLYTEIAKNSRRTDVIAHLAEGGAEAGATTPAEFTLQLRTAVDNWIKVVKSAGIKLE